MRIAVCDDERGFRDRFVKQLKGLIMPEDEISVFGDGAALLDSCKGRYPYDVTFLDVIMPGLNGMEVAAEIRKLSVDAVIVMVSRFREYAYESSMYQPYIFLWKPQDLKKLVRVLDEVRFVIPRSGALTVQTKSESYGIPLRSIYYIEAYDEKVRVTSTRGGDTFYHKFSELCAFLSGHGFYQIHRSVLVNCEYIKNVGKQEVCMTNGERLPIAGARRKDFLAYYVGWLTKT